MTANKARALAAVAAAFLGAIIAQPDVVVQPIVKLGIVAILAGLAAADWGAILGTDSE
jgi:Sec-independent protein secretion pathway component TatC